MNVRFHRLAVAEIDHEVEYYESRQVGLGEVLQDKIDAVLSVVCRFPEAAPLWKHRHVYEWQCWTAFRSRYRISCSSRSS
jgi:hypothetical protein